MKRRMLLRLKCLAASLLFLNASIHSAPPVPPSLTKGTVSAPTPFYPFPVQAPCEILCPGDLTFNLDPGACEMVVNYSVSTTGDCLPSVPVQTSGLPSGSLFPIGVTHNCFNIDLPPLGLPDGDVSCCFDVTVVDYPNPNPSLICTDLAFISLDEDCQHCINASAVLEGGPYGCYDHYLVELDKTPPFGNGPWVPGCVGSSDIGKTYQVRISDPNFPAKCWGNVKIEDKLPPVLECRNLTLPCTSDPLENAEPAPAITGYQKLAYTGLQDAIGALGAPTPDNHDYQFDYSYLPAGTAALDLNCRIKLSGHTRLSDLKIVVKAPDGTSADVFTQADCSGAEWPIDVQFDDEGAGNLASCDQLNIGGAPLQCVVLGISSPTALGVFDGKDASGIWTVSITDDVDLEDGVIEIVGLEVLVDVPHKVPTDNCNGPVTLTYLDTKTAGDCISGYSKVIHRKWTATDAYGNSSTCIQELKFLQQTLADLQLPSDYDGVDAPAFQCTSGVYPSPDWIVSQGLQAWPLIAGMPIGCNIAADYDDDKIPVCVGTYKVRREWTIIDWCTGDVIVHNQIIKVVDSQGPSLSCPENKTVSTDQFNCCGTVNLPDVIIGDDCSGISNFSGLVAIFDTAGQQIGMETVIGSLTDFPGNNLSNPDTLGAMGSTTCLLKGTHLVTYLAEDDCGNTATCSFNLTIRDLVPPVAACDLTTTVGIGTDDPADCYGPAGFNGDPAALDACNFGGIQWVHAAVFDDGSYDECFEKKFTIRRMPPYSDCIQNLNVINGQSPCNDAFPDFPSEFVRAISEGDSIKFYACEVGTIQSVVLRVYQLEANGNFSMGLDGMPIFNECIIQVEVQDKIKPLCVPPADVTINCEQFDPSLSNYGSASVIDNCCLDVTKSYLGQCGLTHTVSYLDFDTICNKGTILRKFNAFDCHNNSAQCTQRIVVDYLQNYYVHFPDDVIVTSCDGTNNFGEPSFFGEDCELMGISYADQVFTIVPDACYKIERRWSVINWCTFNPNLPATDVPNPQPNAIVNHPANLPGPIVSACGALPPWNPTIEKINPTDPSATNFCTFWSSNANRYEYTQIIKIVDFKDPEISNCPAGAVTIADVTPNDPELWQNVFNPNLPVQDLAETETNLSITSSDDCSGANLGEVSFLLFLDLDNDGTMESVLSSTNLPGADTIRYNNLNTPGYLGGTPVTFDSRPVPGNQKWHFALQQSSTTSETTTAVRWNTALEPSIFVTPQLPQGNHKIRWTVTDVCGNQAICEHAFSIQTDSTSGIETLEKDGFALFQNEPNPFSQTTNIGFQLPESAEATLSVFDMEGRLLWGKTDHFKQGHNSVSLEGSLLHAPAVLYYKLESGAHVAWRKMVLIR